MHPSASEPTVSSMTPSPSYEIHPALHHSANTLSDTETRRMSRGDRPTPQPVRFSHRTTARRDRDIANGPSELHSRPDLDPCTSTKSRPAHRATGEDRARRRNQPTD